MARAVDSTSDRSELLIINMPVSFWTGLHSDLLLIFGDKELLRALVTKELRSRYKGSRLGWLWALAKPLVMLLVYSLAVGVFLGANKTIPAFAIYLFSGIILWTLFAQIVSTSISTLVSNRELIRRAAFPKEILIIAVVITAMVDFVIQLVVLSLGYLIYSQTPDWNTVAWLIPGILITVIFAVALGLALSAANVTLRDIGFLTDIGLQVGFWLVPIVYAYSAVAASLDGLQILNWIYLANPMTIAVLCARNGLWPPAHHQYAPFPALNDQLWIWVMGEIVFGLAMLLIAQRFFSIRSRNMAQEL